MIERYTIKPAELDKMKVRIDLIGEAEDIKKLSQL